MILVALSLLACRPPAADETPGGLASKVHDVAFTTLSGASGSAFAAGLGAGDLDGDGHADLIVGATAASGSRGAAYVYAGTKAGIATTVSVTVTGGTGDALGAPAVGVGDVDADGYDDVLIGYTGANGAGLYRGSSTGLKTTAFAELPGHIEAAVAAAGDVNDDGAPDLVVGDWHAAEVSVFLGGDSGVDLSSAVLLSSRSSGDRFGAAVAIADLNGDGVDDLAVGAPTTGGEEGAVYVYLGGSKGLATVATTLPPPTTRTRFGDSLANAGDVDGDGDDDLIVGTNPGSEGAAYVYAGSPTGIATTPTQSLSVAGATWFGEAVAGAGDVNDDGYADVAVAARGTNDRAGAVYVFEGSTAGIGSTPTATLTGKAAGSNFGVAVVGAGDVNGDGYDDLAVADADETSGDGRVYVFHGYAEVDRDGDGVFLPTDCDDADKAVGAPPTLYLDEDGDGYGITAAAVCPGTTGYVATGGDCDDDDANRNPGAKEVCDKDDVDQDCDGLVDDADDSLSLTSAYTWYADTDGDGFGDPANAKDACDPPAGYVSNNKDCDDAAFTTWPGAPDTAGDGVDQDCDGSDAPAVDEDDTDVVDPKGCATAPWAGLWAIGAAAALARRRRG